MVDEARNNGYIFSSIHRCMLLKTKASLRGAFFVFRKYQLLKEG